MRTLATINLVLLIAGCGRGTPEVIPVTGKVYYRGKPLTHGTIIFTPDYRRGNRGPSAQAAIQKDGSFRLSVNEQDGACPGWHLVTILALESTEPRRAGQFRVPRSLLPEKYAHPDLSGLACEVKVGKPNNFTFHLE
ncbi:MAG: hypothetical protein KatS3mg105_1081 [Gemmatales bacterium]|nr:MAG: hypothetical protein KatS3mg105_1081 [Gemmatales bacterium]